MNNRRKQLMLASSREYCKCVVDGKTLKYNQVLKENDNVSLSGITLTPNNDGSVTVNGTAIENVNNFYLCGYWANPDFTKVGHKYFMITGFKDTEGVLADLLVSSNADLAYDYPVDMGEGCIVEAKTTGGTPTTIYGIRLRIDEGANFDNKVIYPMLIDLTELGMDSITTTDQFYETDLGKYIAKGNYLPYEPNGKFIHAQSPINFEGVNIWNEQYRGGCYDTNNGDYISSSSDYEICSKDKIRVKPNTKYYVYSGKVEIGNFAVFYDKNDNFLGDCYYVSNSNCITTHENAYYMNITFGTDYGNVYKNDICISENVWNENWENGIWYYGSKLTGGGYADYICSKDKIKVYPNTKYFYYCGTGRTNDYIQLEFYDKNGTTISRLIRDNKSSFVTPNDCYSMAFYINDSYGNVYNNDTGIFYYGYHKYCGNSVFESGLTLYKGDTYKTYSVDEISYNNLIPNANQDYINSDTDTRASIILSVYDYTNNIGVFAESIGNAGHYEFTFTSNTTTIFGAKVYNSGASINQNFAENISLTNGHLYYMSLNIISVNATQVGGLRIANLRLIDLTQLGLTDLTDKLRIFLQKNYKLPYTLTNKTIKDQIVRTMVEIDLSSLTWTYNSYINAWQSDLSSLFVKSYASNVLPSAIAEKYRTIKYNDYSNAVEGDMWLFSAKPILEIKSNDSVNAPSGKALLELETPELTTWYHLEINDYHEFEQYSGSVYKFDRDLSDLNVFGISADIGENQGGLLFLIGRGNDNDYCYEDGYIYVKSSDIENAWEFDLLINNLPTRMISRRTINVESENEIDLDFTKE